MIHTVGIDGENMALSGGPTGHAYSELHAPPRESWKRQGSATPKKVRENPPPIVLESWGNGPAVRRQDSSFAPHAGAIKPIESFDYQSGRHAMEAMLDAKRQFSPGGELRDEFEEMLREEPARNRQFIKWNEVQVVNPQFAEHAAQNLSNTGRLSSDIMAVGAGRDAYNLSVSEATKPSTLDSIRYETANLNHQARPAVFEAPSSMTFFESSRQSNFSQIQAIADVLEGDERATQIGVCAGLSTVWMNLHHARPGSSSDARMQTLGSFEGMHHALVFQRSYLANVEYLNRHPGFSDGHAQSEARAHLDEVYGVSRDSLVTKLTTSVTDMATTMRGVVGYASLFITRTDKGGKTTGHELMMHRNPADGVVTLFDANQGEFRFEAKDAVRFLQSVQQMFGQVDDQSYQWELTKVRPNSDGAAPLSGLVSALDPTPVPDSAPEQN
ncbi:MAG: hypothetical protein JF606_21995 [Burkholderiales bacterium]|nr:hypothetical protein [Burkholderiales bacterium]